MKNAAGMNAANGAAPATARLSAIAGAVNLPKTAWAAIWRGFAGSCPRCDKARLFRAYLKPVSHCPHCRQDWSLERADDFPAYIAILLTGHLLTPLLVVVNHYFDLSTLAFEALMIPCAIIAVVGFLQPAKGGVIALQWWQGMHGFRKERPVTSADLPPL